MRVGNSPECLLHAVAAVAGGAGLSPEELGCRRNRSKEGAAKIGRMEGDIAAPRVGICGSRENRMRRKISRI